MPDVRSAPERDTTSDVMRLVAIHAAAIAMPVFVVTVFLVPVMVAVVVALAVGVGATAWRLRDIDERVASTTGAVRLAAGERPRLDSVAESVAMAVGVSGPELYVVNAPGKNAVVWGAASGPARCAFTTGLLDAMDRIELEGVVAHQLALVYDGCVERVTVGAVLFGPVAKGPLEPVVASLVHRTVRERSVVEADVDGVRATRYPPGLVEALERVRGCSTALPALPPALNVLCFAAPDQAPGPFSVHPPIEDRIDLLREI